MTRIELADRILERLSPLAADLHTQFHAGHAINTFVVDDLLDPELARAIYEAFPKKDQMMLRATIRENKYVAAQMDRCDPLVEEAVYAFQDPRLVALVGEITGVEALMPDDRLYAGGLSLMALGNFLNPHLDNSHDKDRERYRVLNLLYYVTPDWHEEYGGNLELWDEGIKGPRRVIPSLFNRLAVMVTHEGSWHSVNKVIHDGQRCCVSNYYFSPVPVRGRDYFHVTSFRGRPDEPVKDLALQLDAAVRAGIRKVARKGLVEPKHQYKRS